MMKAFRRIHHFLALVHRVDDMKLRDAGMSDFDPVEKLGNDSCHMSAAFYGTVGNPSHQTVPSAAIDKSQSVTGNQLSEIMGGLCIGPVQTR